MPSRDLRINTLMLFGNEAHGVARDLQIDHHHVVGIIVRLIRSLNDDGVIFERRDLIDARCRHDGFCEAALNQGLLVEVKRRREMVGFADFSRSSQRSKTKTCWRTYIVEAVGIDRIKIGRSQSLNERLIDLKIGCPTDLELLWVIDGDFEKRMHDRFAEHRVRGEWFVKSGVLSSIRALRSSTSLLERYERELVELVKKDEG